MDKYNDMDKNLSQKEGENDKLKKDYDSLLNIHNGEKKYLQQRLVDSKHTTQIIAIDYAYQFCRKNRDGYSTKNVMEMVNSLHDFLKK